MEKRSALIRSGLASLVLLLFPVADGHSQDDVLSALPQTAKAPADNPISAGKAALGRLLFWDPILSGNKDVACASCHHPSFGYSDHRDVSIGVNGIGLGEDRQFASPNSIPFVKRNSQTLLNVAFNGVNQTGQYDPAAAPMFWDMRVTSLEAQALEPIKAFEEMRGDAYTEDKAVAAVVARLNAIPEYRTLFRKAFGGENAVSAANLGKALATFERTLLANNSPFDRYMRGDRNAMTGAQIAGMERFESTGCTNCHNGPMFSDYKPHVLGVPDNPKLAESDRGINDAPYAFRTASLRDLAFTAPYMHDGAFQTLQEVVRFYRRPPRNPNVGRREVDPLVRQLRRPARAADEIIEFLSALNDDSFDKSIPSRVPSGLNPGGRIQQELPVERHNQEKAMAGVIQQEVMFRASPKRVYDALLDSGQFSEFTGGAAAEINRDPGGAFSCFGGMITGRNVELIPDQRIVQAWRVGNWPEGAYSIVSFELKAQGANTLLSLRHSGFPEGTGEHLESGWRKMYWEPLQKYLVD